MVYENNYDRRMSAKQEMEETESTRRWLDSRIKQSSPSDIIVLTHQEDVFLQELWMGDDMHNRCASSDIVFADTIPLADCVIEVDERDDFDNGMLVRYRVIIFEEEVKYAKKRAEMYPDKNAVIGVVIADAPINDVFYLPITVSARHINVLAVTPIAKNEKAELIYQNIYAPAIKACMDALPSLLFTWYGIQIALLHPDVKEVFKNPTRQIANAGTGKGERQRKAKYIRKHILTLSDLENAAHTNEARKYNRKCLVWYVIGHWREYSNGKRVFIKPYWKGVLRQTKRNADGDERIRIIRKEQTACMN